MPPHLTDVEEAVGLREYGRGHPVALDGQRPRHRADHTINRIAGSSQLAGSCSGVIT